MFTSIPGSLYLASTLQANPFSQELPEQVHQDDPPDVPDPAAATAPDHRFSKY